MLYVDSFRQAYKWRANRPATRVIVIHSAESQELSDNAEAVQSYFTQPSAGGSAHVTVDNNSIAGSVQWKDQAAHAPGTNSDGIGIEHAGRARQTRAEWLDAYGVPMLDKSAWLAAQLCRDYGIPVKRLTNAELKAGQKGLVSHFQVSQVYGGTHWDPGEGFPWDHYLARIAHHSNTTPPGDTPMSASEVAEIKAEITRLALGIVSLDSKTQAPYSQVSIGDGTTYVIVWSGDQPVKWAAPGPAPLSMLINAGLVEPTVRTITGGEVDWVKKLHTVDGLEAFKPRP